MEKYLEPEKFVPFYESDTALLYRTDAFVALENIREQCADLIFADPPYFLSNGGITCKNGRMVSVNKGMWDACTDYQQKYEFNRRWLSLCKRVLKPDGTIWISGTLHNIYVIGALLEELGYKIINNIIWQKKNPPPNLACKCFTHSTETILWAKLDNDEPYYFNYQLMKQLNENKQMKDVWSGSLTPQREKIFGKHPTQKPLYLLERIVDAASREGDVILDPFAGSSSTGVAAISKGRRFIGFDLEEPFLKLSAKRLQQAEISRKHKPVNAEKAPK
ncbi:MAG: site-specific DNA-methyltransferase [Succinivibrionaceae bacterium]|nr:site-specific DNA-methyltransferase [Succinivibrionaceae bacterium]